MKEEIANWADKAMYDAAPMQSIEPQVHLLSATPDPLGAIAAACRMYEGKPTYALKDITDEEREAAWQQVNETHLKAPLEFVDLHFFIEGVTRSNTHQMVRQRTAVYAQESLRFAVKGEMSKEVALPPSLQGGDKKRARDMWLLTTENLEEVYNALIGEGVPAEDARGLLPHAITTRLNYKTNLRNLLEHAGNRLCTQAQYEWRAVFAGIVKAIHDYSPPQYEPRSVHAPIVQKWNKWQFELIAGSGVFKPVCFQLGHCPFNAKFDRGCTIRKRVEEGRFDQINYEEWMYDPTAGRVL